jgi:hypothetical protein
MFFHVGYASPKKYVKFNFKFVVLVLPVTRFFVDICPSDVRTTVTMVTDDDVLTCEGSETTNPRSAELGHGHAVNRPSAITEQYVMTTGPHSHDVEEQCRGVVNTAISVQDNREVVGTADNQQERREVVGTADIQKEDREVVGTVVCIKEECLDNMEGEGWAVMDDSEEDIADSSCDHPEYYENNDGASMSEDLDSEQTRKRKTKRKNKIVNVKIFLYSFDT